MSPGLNVAQILREGYESRALLIPIAADGTAARVGNVKIWPLDPPRQPAGISVTREEEGLLVTAVNKDGPYGEILSVGDMVLEVAGYQAAQLRAAEFGALLDDGEPHRTVVVRSCALRDWDTSCSEAQR